MLWFRDWANVCKDVGLSSTWWTPLGLSLCSLTGDKDFSSDVAQLYRSGRNAKSCSLLQTAVSVCLFPGLRSLTTVREQGQPFRTPGLNEIVKLVVHHGAILLGGRKKTACSLQVPTAPDSIFHVPWTGEIHSFIPSSGPRVL